MYKNVADQRGTKEMLEITQIIRKLSLLEIRLILT